VVPSLGYVYNQFESFLGARIRNIARVPTPSDGDSILSEMVNSVSETLRSFKLSACGGESSF
jgi:hypothetical protein